MEITEIISSYINKGNNLLRVEFQVLNDDSVKSDIIEYHYVKEFGYDVEIIMDVFDNYDTDYDELEMWDDDGDEVLIDDVTLTSFLNEYYVVFPDKKPDEEYN